jgi:hypothetical protein
MIHCSVVRYHQRRHGATPHVGATRVRSAPENKRSAAALLISNVVNERRHCFMLSGTLPPFSATLRMTALCRAMFCSALP